MRIREKKIVQGQLEILSHRKTTNIENEEYRERKKLQKLRENKKFNPDTKLEDYEYEGVQHITKGNGKEYHVQFVARSELLLRPGMYSLFVVGWDLKSEGVPLISIEEAIPAPNFKEDKKDAK